MAGSYANVPGRRVAWDDDGTVGVYFIGGAADVTAPGGPWTAIPAATAENLNSEENADFLGVGTSNTSQNWACLIFPELRDLKGFFSRVRAATSGGHRVDTSADTTNGLDGTWTNRSTADTGWTGIGALDDYRDSIASLSVSGIRSVRFKFQGANVAEQWFWRNLHVYASIASGQTPDRLLWIDDTTGLEFVLDKDYGDIPRGSARDIIIKLKNNSGSLTANTIAGAREDLYLGSAAWYTYSIGGGAYGSTFSITSLAAGATSSAITLRQDVADAATLSVHAARAYVTVASWT